MCLHLEHTSDTHWLNVGIWGFVLSLAWCTVTMPAWMYLQKKT
jgi:hypothetical protein